MATDPGAAAISALVSVAADSSPTVAAAAAEQLRLLLYPRRCSVLSQQPSISLLEKRITHLLAAAAGLVRRRVSNSLLPLQRAHLLAALAHVFGSDGDRAYDEPQERCDVQTMECESLQKSEATVSPDPADNSATILPAENSASTSLQDQALAVNADVRETSTESAVDTKNTEYCTEKDDPPGQTEESSTSVPQPEALSEPCPKETASSPLVEETEQLTIESLARVISSVVSSNSDAEILADRCVEELINAFRLKDENFDGLEAVTAAAADLCVALPAALIAPKVAAALTTSPPLPTDTERVLCGVLQAISHKYDSWMAMGLHAACSIPDNRRAWEAAVLESLAATLASSRPNSHIPAAIVAVAPLSTCEKVGLAKTTSSSRIILTALSSPHWTRASRPDVRWAALAAQVSLSAANSGLSDGHLEFGLEGLRQELCSYWSTRVDTSLLEDDKAESLYYYLARSLGALSRVAVTTVEETKKSTPPSAQAAETAKQGSLSPAATVFVEAVVASLSLVASFSNYHQGESPLCGVPSRALEVAKILVRKFETAHLEATILAAIAGDQVLFSCCGGAESALGALLFSPDLKPLVRSPQRSKSLKSWHPCELNGKAIVFLFDKIAAAASISVDNAPQVMARVFVLAGSNLDSNYSAFANIINVLGDALGCPRIREKCDIAVGSDRDAKSKSESHAKALDQHFSSVLDALNSEKVNLSLAACMKDQAKLYGGRQSDSVMQQATFLRLYGIILRKTFSKDLVTSHLDAMTEMALQWTSGIATNSKAVNEDVNEYGRGEEDCWSSFAEKISSGFAHGLGMASVSHLDLALERLEQLLVRLGSVHQHSPTLPEDKKWSLFGMIFGTTEHVQAAQTRPNNIVCALVSLGFAKVIALGPQRLLKMRFNEKIVDVFAKWLCPEHSVSASFARSAVLEGLLSIGRSEALAAVPPEIRSEFISSAVSHGRHCPEGSRGRSLSIAAVAAFCREVSTSTPQRPTFAPTMASPSSEATPSSSEAQGATGESQSLSQTRDAIPESTRQWLLAIAADLAAMEDDIGMEALRIAKPSPEELLDSFRRVCTKSTVKPSAVLELLLELRHTCENPADFHGRFRFGTALGLIIVQPLEADIRSRCLQIISIAMGCESKDEAWTGANIVANLTMHGSLKPSELDDLKKEALAGLRKEDVELARRSLDIYQGLGIASEGPQTLGFPHLHKLDIAEIITCYQNRIEIREEIKNLLKSFAPAYYETVTTALISQIWKADCDNTDTKSLDGARNLTLDLLSSSEQARTVMLTKMSECLNSWPAPSRKLGDHTVLTVIEIVIALIARLKSNGSALDIETAYQLISGLTARGCHYYDVEDSVDKDSDGGEGEACVLPNSQQRMALKLRAVLADVVSLANNCSISVQDCWQKDEKAYFLEQLISLLKRTDSASSEDTGQLVLSVIEERISVIRALAAYLNTGCEQAWDLMIDTIILSEEDDLVRTAAVERVEVVLDSNPEAFGLYFKRSKLQATLNAVSFGSCNPSEKMALTYTKALATLSRLAISIDSTTVCACISSAWLGSKSECKVDDKENLGPGTYSPRSDTNDEWVHVREYLVDALGALKEAQGDSKIDVQTLAAARSLALMEDPSAIVRSRARQTTRHLLRSLDQDEKIGKPEQDDNAQRASSSEGYSIEHAVNDLALRLKSRPQLAEAVQAMLLADIRANYGVALSAAIASLGMIAHFLPSRQKIYDAVLKSFAKFWQKPDGYVMILIAKSLGRILTNEDSSS